MLANLLQDDIDKQRCLPESGCCTQMATIGWWQQERSDSQRETQRGGTLQKIFHGFIFTR